jgi:hypothetical protein
LANFANHKVYVKRRNINNLRLAARLPPMTKQLGMRPAELLNSDLPPRYWLAMNEKPCKRRERQGVRQEKALEGTHASTRRIGC